jgi:hypothetical protein
VPGPAIGQRDAFFLKEREVDSDQLIVVNSAVL